MNIIAAADKNFGIGYKGQLLAHIKEDMRFFKEMTTGKAVIMGRETFLSFPNQKPLADRKNFVLTTNPQFNREGITVCSSLEEAIEEAKKDFSSEDIFFIGGERVYKESIKYANKAYITKIDKEFKADRFIINFDKEKNWQIESEREVNCENGLKITFTLYKKSISE